MRRFICVLLSVLLLYFCRAAYAHPGQTDGNGGHYDNSAGEYHFHHGYPAHKHTNGRCPYDYDDKTGAGSGASSSDSQYSWPYTSAPRPTSATRKTNPPRATSAQYHSVSLLKSPWFYVICVVGISFLCYAVHCINENQEQKRRYEEECRRAEAERRLKEAEDLRKKQEAEKARIRQNEEERLRMVAYYRNNDLRKLSGMPSDIDVKNISRYGSRFRCDVYSAGDLVSVWVSSMDSAVYHTHQCRYGVLPVSPYDPHVRLLHPCKMCSPLPLPDDAWYKEFVNLYTDCLTYGITPTISPSQYLAETERVLELYRSQYPATWAYISRHAHTPEKYILTYHQIWGKLHEEHGDGMIFSTLSASDQKLINYPHLGNEIYLSSIDARTYHSTTSCYALLKVARPVSVSKELCSCYKRCSKCVHPT